MSTEKLHQLHITIKKLYYTKSKELLFHGWHHINFVTKKSKIFAESIDANVFLVQSAALVHDLNYIEPEDDGAQLRKELLLACDYSIDEINTIEQIIQSAHTATRQADVSQEVKALSDADTLFKALPFTPIIFASKYIQQNKIDIQKLARKITQEQNALFDQGIYFYTPLAQEKYMTRAKANLALWSNVIESFTDPDIAEVLSLAQELGVL